MAGLVIKDLAGGDFMVSLVSDDLWNQIQEVSSSLEEDSDYSEKFFRNYIVADRK